jgi:hypothetical protein
MIGRNEFAEMATALGSPKGRFILSINGRPEVRELFAPFRMDQVELTFTVAGGRNAAPARELVITSTMEQQLLEDEVDNIEIFNALVGLIFDQLYRSFPIPTSINTDEIAQSLGVQGYTTSDTILPGRTIVSEWGLISSTSFWDLYNGSIDWLKDERFVREPEHESFVLTADALAALNARPSSLSMPLGKRLGEAATNVGTEAGRAAISEVVGQLIGAAARGLIGA